MNHSLAHPHSPIPVLSIKVRPACQMDFLGGSVIKNLPVNAGDFQEMQARSLGWEDPLEEAMATHSSIPAWEIPRIEEPGGLQPVGSQRLGCHLVTKQQHVANAVNILASSL